MTVVLRRQRELAALVGKKLGDQLDGLLPDDTETQFLRACLHEGSSVRQAWLDWESHATQDGCPLHEALAPVAPFLPLLAWNLKKNGVSLDEGIGSLLRSACLTEEVRGLKYRTICGSAFGALSSAGVPFIALKGAALIELVYPLPLLRHVGDIDVLLRRADLQRAAAVLGQLGWCAQSGPILTNPGHLPAIAHSSGLSIELHERLLIPYYALPYERLWEHSRPATLAGVEARVLSAADNLLHVCAHAMSGDGIRILRWVPDAWFILEREPALDWELFLSTSRSARLSLPTYLAMRYLADEIGAAVPAKVIAELRAGASRTGFRGRCAARLGARPWPSGSLRDIWAGSESGRGRLVRVWQRVFPPPVEFALRYDIPAWALPAYYVLRVARYTQRAERSAAP